jgi:hypothetical protein
MSRREFATYKKLHDFAQRNGLIYLWSGTAAFAKRQRLLSPEQYEIVEVRARRGMRPVMLFSKALLQAEWDADAPRREAMAIKRERWLANTAEKKAPAHSPRLVESQECNGGWMPAREFASQKALLDYAEQKGLVYVWAFIERQRLISPAFAERQRLLSPDQYEIVDVRTSRGVRRAMLFHKAILQAEFEANRDVLATKRERWRAKRATKHRPSPVS